VSSVREFFAAPEGTADGDGSPESPWDLATALGHPVTLRPGDTIWLRGGTYRGSFRSYLTGAPDRPIRVRQYPGERATVDGGNSGGAAVLTIQGGYTVYQGFEITSSDPDRESATSEDFPSDMPRGEGITSAEADGIRLLDLIIHDTRQGISAFSGWTNTEVSGCLIYYNGWQSAAGGYGHGIYTQNATGTKRFVGNVVFDQFSHGLHAYTEGGSLEGFVFEDNAFFGNGRLSSTGGGRNFLLGGLQPVRRARVSRNILHQKPGGPQTSFDIGYRAGCAETELVGNIVSDNTIVVNCPDIRIVGNAFRGIVAGFSPSEFPDNRYELGASGGLEIFRLPQRDDSNRLVAVVLNPERLDAVDVDFGPRLSSGTRYLVRHAQDPFGPPIAEGRAASSVLRLPTTGLAVTSPVGWPAPAPTGPDFVVYLLEIAEATAAPRTALPPPPRTPRALGRP
jgi:hypothetical protein